MEKTVEAIIAARKSRVSATDSLRSSKSVGAHSIGALSIFDPETADTLPRDEVITFDIYDDQSIVVDRDQGSRPISGVIESWQDLGDEHETAGQFSVQKSTAKQAVVNGDFITPMKNGWHSAAGDESVIINESTSNEAATGPSSYGKTMVTEERTVTTRGDSKAGTVITSTVTTSSSRGLHNGGESASSTLESQKGGEGVRKKGSFTLKSAYTTQNIKQDRSSNISQMNGEIGGDLESSLNRKMVKARSNVVNGSNLNTAVIEREAAYGKEKTDHVPRNVTESYTVSTEAKRPIETHVNSEPFTSSSLVQTRIHDTSETTAISGGQANKAALSTKVVSTTTVSGGAVAVSGGTDKESRKKGLYSKRSYALTQDSDGDTSVKKSGSSSQSSSSVSSSAAASRTSSSASKDSVISAPRNEQASKGPGKFQIKHLPGDGTSEYKQVNADTKSATSTKQQGTVVGSSSEHSNRTSSRVETGSYLTHSESEGEQASRYAKSEHFKKHINSVIGSSLAKPYSPNKGAVAKKSEKYSRTSSSGSDAETVKTTPGKLQIGSTPVRSTSETVTTPNTPVTPKEEIKGTIKEGSVGKLVKDIFWNKPLTGRSYDPSTLERQKEKAAAKAAEPPTPTSPDKKYRFVVEGIDVPAQDEQNNAAVSSPSPTQDQSDSGNTEVDEDTLKREEKKGFTYLLDRKLAAEIRKRAEDVTARKSYEVIEEKTSKRESTGATIESQALIDAKAKLKHDRPPSVSHKKDSSSDSDSNPGNERNNLFKELTSVTRKRYAASNATAATSKNSDSVVSASTSKYRGSAVVETKSGSFKKPVLEVSSKVITEDKRKSKRDSSSSSTSSTTSNSETSYTVNVDTVEEPVPREQSTPLPRASDRSAYITTGSSNAAVTITTGKDVITSDKTVPAHRVDTVVSSRSQQANIKSDSKSASYSFSTEKPGYTERTQIEETSRYTVEPTSMTSTRKDLTKEFDSVDRDRDAGRSVGSRSDSAYQSAGGDSTPSPGFNIDTILQQAQSMMPEPGMVSQTVAHSQLDGSGTKSLFEARKKYVQENKTTTRIYDPDAAIGGNQGVKETKSESRTEYVTSFSNANTGGSDFMSQQRAHSNIPMLDANSSVSEQRGHLTSAMHSNTSDVTDSDIGPIDTSTSKKSRHRDPQTGDLGGQLGANSASVHTGLNISVKDGSNGTRVTSHGHRDETRHRSQQMYDLDEFPVSAMPAASAVHSDFTGHTSGARSGVNNNNVPPYSSLDSTGDAHGGTMSTMQHSQFSSSTGISTQRADSFTFHHDNSWGPGSAQSTNERSRGNVIQLQPLSIDVNTVNHAEMRTYPANKNASPYPPVMSPTSVKHKQSMFEISHMNSGYGGPDYYLDTPSHRPYVLNMNGKPRSVEDVRFESIHNTRNKYEGGVDYNANRYEVYDVYDDTSGEFSGNFKHAGHGRHNDYHMASPGSHTRVLKVDESRSGRVPVYQSKGMSLHDLEAAQYQTRDRRGRLLMRVDGDYPDNDNFSTISDPAHRIVRRVSGRRMHRGGGGGLSSSQPSNLHLAHMSPNGGMSTMMSAHSYGGDTTIMSSKSSGTNVLAPHLAGANKSGDNYHITVKLNKFGIPGSVSQSYHETKYMDERDAGAMHLTPTQVGHGGGGGLVSPGKVNLTLDARGLNAGNNTSTHYVDSSSHHHHHQHHQQSVSQVPDDINMYIKLQGHPGTESGRHVTRIGTSGGDAGARAHESSTSMKFYSSGERSQEDGSFDNTRATSSKQQQIRHGRGQDSAPPSHGGGSTPHLAMNINQTMTMDYAPDEDQQPQQPVITETRTQKSSLHHQHQSAGKPVRERHTRKRTKMNSGENLEDYLSPAEEDDIEKRRREDGSFPQVVRGSILIKNAIDTTGAPKVVDIVGQDDSGSSDEDDFLVEDDPNLFGRKYFQARENPMYSSDEDLSKLTRQVKQGQQKPQFARIFDTTDNANESGRTIPIERHSTQKAGSRVHTRGGVDEADFARANGHAQGGDDDSDEERFDETTEETRRWQYEVHGEGRRQRPRPGARAVTESRSAKFGRGTGGGTDIPIQRAGAGGGNRTTTTTTTTSSSRGAGGAGGGGGGGRGGGGGLRSEHLDLQRLIRNAPAGSVKQTINVDREEEEILGPLTADGQNLEDMLNFDTISEKVDIGLLDGKAQLAVIVRCDRIVPIRGVEDMFKKSSVIVTRIIEIDLFVTEERRQLYENVMKRSQTNMLDDKPHTGGYIQPKLSSKDTFRLYKTFMGLAEYEEGRKHDSMQVDAQVEEQPYAPDMDRETEGYGSNKVPDSDTISYMSAASDTSDIMY